jgi:hypothetical protein
LWRILHYEETDPHQYSLLGGLFDRKIDFTFPSKSLQKRTACANPHDINVNQRARLKKTLKLRGRQLR